MYANLLVVTSGGKELVAHEVVVTSKGEVIVKLDDPDEEGFAPRGELHFGGMTDLKITASF